MCLQEVWTTPVAPERKRGPPKKRRRIVVSCTECHRRKQKCDRDLPCKNCRGRNRESSCTYDAGAPTAKGIQSRSARSPHYKQLQPRPPLPTGQEHPQRQERQANGGDDVGGRGHMGDETLSSMAAETLSSMAAAFGYSQTGASTMSFLKRIEAADSDDAGQRSPSAPLMADSPAMRERYRTLIRQLPARNYMDRLIDLFMRRFNWYYGSVDPDVFQQQLDEWYRLPFQTLSTMGPVGLSADLRVFPAVLFQIIATALVIVPDEEDSEFNALKYAGNMSFVDLATDYSESGVAIVNLFGKKNLTITTVVAQFLRASFLKFTAHVTESWHSISMAIRDAQDLGMHRDSLDPKPANASAESALENQWLIQRRRKLYLILFIWDINMTLVLGRPGCIDWRHHLPSLPVDVAAPVDRKRTPVAPRDEERDPPTPLVRTLWAYQLTRPLREIQDLEREGPWPKDFSKVNRVHEMILDLEEHKPAILRLENPDTRWDDHPDMHWLAESRFYYVALHEFSLMALHRPYIFNRKESRREALKAAINMLELQRRNFGDLPRDSWANFDGIVIIACIYILFPREHPEYKQTALQQFVWTVERFSAMQERNPLARSAQGVLRTIQAKFLKAIGAEGTSPAATGTELSMAQTLTTANSETSSSSTTRGGTATETTATPASSTGQLPGDSGGAPPLLPPLSSMLGDPTTTAGVDWSMDALSSIAPLYPTSDLIFNDLNAIQYNMLGLPPLGDSNDAAGGVPWQFGGGFGDDAVWQYLNQCYPAPPA